MKIDASISMAEGIHVLMHVLILKVYMYLCKETGIDIPQWRLILRLDLCRTVIAGVQLMIYDLRSLSLSHPRSTFSAIVYPPTRTAMNSTLKWIKATRCKERSIKRTHF